MRVLIAEERGHNAGRARGAMPHVVVEVVGTGLEAIQAFTRHRPDVVLMDYSMPRLNGATACRNILSRHPKAKIILVSGMRTAEIEDAGAFATLAKPVALEELYAVLYSAGSPPPVTE